MNALHADPDLEDAVHMLDRLAADEQWAVLCETVQAALAYVRSGDVSHLTGRARALLAGLQARRR
jgi:hypothetical protein